MLPIGIGGNTLDVYNITDSLRLRDSASAYLTRTPASAGNRQKWTYSAWVKLGEVVQGAGGGSLFYAGNTTSSPRGGIVFGNSGTSKISVYGMLYNSATTVLGLETTAEYRDPSAWYHIVVALDTTQATASNRCKLYVNGEQVTSFGTATYPSQNQELQYNDAIVHATRHPSGNYRFDGYIAENHFIDGQALDPTSFGETNGNGVWSPKKYTGTYGTNGFYLPFNSEVVPSVSAGFGGTASNVLYDDTAYLVSNTSTGSSFDLVEYDFGESINMIDYNIQDFRFTGGTSTFKIYTSVVGGSLSNYTERASLSVSSSYQNYSGNLGVTARYIKIRATAFGTNGQGQINYFNVDVDANNFSDNSGNANNWTPNNINLVVDITSDVPTLTDEDTSNFATINPNDKKSTLTLSDGNLKATGANASYNNGYSTMQVPKDTKIYFEVTVVNSLAGGNNLAFYLDSVVDWSRVGNNAGSWGLDVGVASTYYTSLNGSSSNTGISISNGHVTQMAIDQASGKIWLGINNTWLSSGNPSTGANPIGTISTTADYYIRALCYSSGSIAFNFGQIPFAYTPPTGFKKLNTFNLTDSSITDGSEYMQAISYSGNGSSQDIVTGFSPDLVWTKSRSTTDYHWINDSIRGISKYLNSNITDAESTFAGGVTSLNSDGYTVEYSGSNAWNASGQTYVGWSWRGSDSTAVSNTDGTITSTVSANTDSGFSVVTYVGTAAVATVGHGLGVAPSMIITKNRDTTTDWWVYHAALGNTKYMVLNTTAASVTSSAAWNNTSPTSTVFTLGGAGNPSNANQDVAYCFAEVEGYSKIGSYVGNGVNGDGPFVYCGFRPAFILFKNTNTTQNWIIHDVARDTYNYARNWLFPNTSGAEYTDANIAVDLLSNGFKIRTSIGTELNGNGNTIIYMAFAENPFKNSLAR